MQLLRGLTKRGERRADSASYSQGHIQSPTDTDASGRPLTMSPAPQITSPAMSEGQPIPPRAIRFTEPVDLRNRELPPTPREIQENSRRSVSETNPRSRAERSTRSRSRSDGADPNATERRRRRRAQREAARESNREAGRESGREAGRSAASKTHPTSSTNGPRRSSSHTKARANIQDQANEPFHSPLQDASHRAESSFSSGLALRDQTWAQSTPADPIWSRKQRYARAATEYSTAHGPDPNQYAPARENDSLWSEGRTVDHSAEEGINEPHLTYMQGAQAPRRSVARSKSPSKKPAMPFKSLGSASQVLPQRQASGKNKILQQAREIPADLATLATLDVGQDDAVEEETQRERDELWMTEERERHAALQASQQGAKASADITSSSLSPSKLPKSSSQSISQGIVTPPRRRSKHRQSLYLTPATGADFAAEDDFDEDYLDVDDDPLPGVPEQFGTPREVFETPKSARIGTISTQKPSPSPEARDKLLQRDDSPSANWFSSTHSKWGSTSNQNKFSEEKQLASSDESSEASDEFYLAHTAHTTRNASQPTPAVVPTAAPVLDKEQQAALILQEEQERERRLFEREANLRAQRHAREREKRELMEKEAAAEKLRKQEQEAAKRARELEQAEKERLFEKERQRRLQEEAARRERMQAELMRQQNEITERKRRILLERRQREERERAERERIKNEEAERERVRLEAELARKKEEERLEQERLAIEREARLEAERIAAEQAAQQREAQLKQQQEQEKLERQRREAQELEQQQQEEARIQREIRLEREEAERLAALQAENLARERQELEQMEQQERLQQLEAEANEERLRKERAFQEQQRKEQEELERQELLEQELLQRQEQERQERMLRERREEEQREREQILLREERERKERLLREERERKERLLRDERDRKERQERIRRMERERREAEEREKAEAAALAEKQREEMERQRAQIEEKALKRAKREAEEEDRMARSYGRRREEHLMPGTPNDDESSIVASSEADHASNAADDAESDSNFSQMFSKKLQVVSKSATLGLQGILSRATPEKSKIASPNNRSPSPETAPSTPTRPKFTAEDRMPVQSQTTGPLLRFAEMQAPRNDEQYVVMPFPTLPWLSTVVMQGLPTVADHEAPYMVGALTPTLAQSALPMNPSALAANPRWSMQSIQPSTTGQEPWVVKPQGPIRQDRLAFFPGYTVHGVASDDAVVSTRPASILAMECLVTDAVQSSLLVHLNISELRRVAELSKDIRRKYTSKQFVQQALHRYLSCIGWHPMQDDPMPLSLQDCEAFLFSNVIQDEYQTAAEVYLTNGHQLDRRMPRIARASLRAHAKVLARVRLEPEQVPTPTLDKVEAWDGVLALSTHAGLTKRMKITPPHQIGHVSLFKVWLPEGETTEDAYSTELQRTERELFIAGTWRLLQRGDMALNIAKVDHSNEGRYIFNGEGFVPLPTQFDPIGHLPSYINMMLYPPGFYNGVIRSSRNSPVMYLDLLPWRTQIVRSIQLVRDNVETLGANSQLYRVAKWLYRAVITIEMPTTDTPSHLESPFDAHHGWNGTVVLDAEGTSEHARALLLRCVAPREPESLLNSMLQAVMDGNCNEIEAPEVQPYEEVGTPSTYPWAVLRERSRAGLVWLRLL
ncbi:hypothetical protein MPSI1_003096 [Malassezia psittaci]|uniref:Uncharacterized protein n=1 Tax=Malassezia psittaci TaxID=1821823 RepID=A0AAF0JF69_9BASI|nr:hypothetical protein MPSI1_003096 [Malassezia psittaci]